MTWLLRTLEALYRVLPHRCIWTLTMVPTGGHLLPDLSARRPILDLYDECTKCGTSTKRLEQGWIDGEGLLRIINLTQVHSEPVRITGARRACSVSPGNWGSE